MKYARAVTSIVKTTFGMGKVTDEEYHRRLAACSKCPALVDTILAPKCAACHCLIELKARDKKETCPINRPEWRVSNAPSK